MNSMFSFLKTGIVLFCMIWANQLMLAQSVEYDRQLGASSAQQVAEQMGVSDNPATTAYLDSLGQKLVDKIGEQPFDYSFRIVAMDEPNAFALPGGYVYVSRGLLWLANSEDELAGVIGHEIIHAYRRHSVKSQRRGILPAILQLPGAIVGTIDEDLGKAINSPFSAGGKAYLASYGRKQEREADRKGIVLSSLAGYRPESLADILLRISDEVKYLTGEEETFSYLNDHPLTPERVEDILKRSQKLEVKDYPPIAADQKAFLHKLEGTLVGPDPSQGVFTDSIFLHPDLNLAMLFPRGWKTACTPVMVGAVQPDQKAQLLLGIAGEADEPEKFGKAFASKLFEKYKVKPSKTEAVDINGHKAYLVSLTDSSEAEPMAIHLLWVNWEDVTLQIIGLGYEGYRDQMSESILSIRSLSEKEKNSFSQTALRIVEAKSGETIADVCKRLSCPVKAEVIALFNGLKLDETLSEGQLLKVGVKEPYVSKKKK